MTAQPFARHEFLAVLFFGSFALTYTLYYFATRSDAFRTVCNRRLGAARGPVMFVLLQRAIMVVGTGVLPITVIATVGVDPGRFGLRLPFSPLTALAAVGMMLVSAAVSVFAAKPEEKLATYPQIRSERWTWGTVAVNAISWGLYLFAYELTFRGFLFAVLLPYGLWTSIAVNTALYVAVHVPKGASEAAGAFVYGPVLCLLTYWSGTIWIAWLAHLALALGNSYSSLAANPDMHGPFSRSTDRDSSRP